MTENWNPIMERLQALGSLQEKADTPNKPATSLLGQPAASRRMSNLTCLNRKNGLAPKGFSFRGGYRSRNAALVLSEVVWKARGC